MSASALHHHLDCCVDCTAWLEQATALGRTLRVTGEVPTDLSSQILAAAALPVARVRRYQLLLRAMLALVGLVQFGLALPGLFGDQLDMQMSLHASHESAAWNCAVAAAFLAVAVRPSRASGALPMLTTFVMVLSVVSLPDLLDGAVTAGRLSSHLAVVAGLVLVLLTNRSHRLLPGTSGAAAMPEAGNHTSALPRGRWRGAA